MATALWSDYPNVISMQQFSRKGLEGIINHALRFEHAKNRLKPLPRESKLFAWRMLSLFYEPSTRTSYTFEDAARTLGCHVTPIKDPGTFSSAVKGESFEEAMAAYTCTGGLGAQQLCDIVVLRHSEAGASERAVKVIETAKRGTKLTLPLPVINAGDGTGQHPTQALVDLTTIFAERNIKGRPLDNLTILIPGDLERSRVVNSLLYALGKFGRKHKITVWFCCPRSFGPKVKMLEYLARNGIRYDFFSCDMFPKLIGRADIIYMTRVQRERKSTQGTKFRRKWREQLIFRKKYASWLKKGAFVMHPLPINRDPMDPPSEIDQALAPQAQAGDPRFAWMRQSHRGSTVRLALLDLILCSFDEAMRNFSFRSVVNGQHWSSAS